MAGRAREGVQRGRRVRRRREEEEEEEDIGKEKKWMNVESPSCNEVVKRVPQN